MTSSPLSRAMNAQDAEVHEFKAPSKAATTRDFLWRLEKQVPSDFGVGIFNRPHYRPESCLGGGVSGDDIPGTSLNIHCTQPAQSRHDAKNCPKIRKPRTAAEAT
jgi:hypothetical protein